MALSGFKTKTPYIELAVNCRASPNLSLNLERRKGEIPNFMLKIALLIADFRGPLTLASDDLRPGQYYIHNWLSDLGHWTSRRALKIKILGFL